MRFITEPRSRWSTAASRPRKQRKGAQTRRVRGREQSPRDALFAVWRKEVSLCKCTRDHEGDGTLQLYNLGTYFT